jgi:hypothetical protein
MSFFKLNFCLSLFFLSLQLQAQVSKCADHILIAGVGDILIHEALQVEAQKSPEKFYSLWKTVTPYISAADLAYANLETPVALGITADGIDLGDIGFRYDHKIYSGTDMRFNSHPQLIADVQKLGIGIVSTANNHAMDRKAIGIDRTYLELNRQHLAFTGTRLSDGKGEWGVVREVKGKRIFWLACTEHLNGHPDKYNQVLKCFDNEDEITRLVQNAVKEYDAVILLPHWGVEYSQTPTAQQRKWATKMAQLGVTAIIGNHPHVMQPVEKIGNMIVAFSLGNFAAWQKDTERKTSVILYLDLQTASDGKLRVKQFKGVPVYRVEQTIYAAYDKLNPAAMNYVSKHLGADNIVMGVNFDQITRCH